MEPSLSAVLDGRVRLRIVSARVLQEIGWAGVGGLVLCTAAVLIARSASEPSPTSALPTFAVLAPVPAPHAQLAPLVQVAQRGPLASGRTKVRLAERAGINVLLARIERAATGNGLAWSAADYRVVPATDREPAALEIRCSFKAPYPLLRSMISDLVGTLPAMTFREMSFSRADVGSADVDAKFAIAVFLEDESSVSTGAR